MTYERPISFGIHGELPKPLEISTDFSLAGETKQSRLARYMFSSAMLRPESTVQICSASVAELRKTVAHVTSVMQQSKWRVLEAFYGPCPRKWRNTKKGRRKWIKSKAARRHYSRLARSFYPE